ncbi:MAG TPA: DoxX family protein [Ohtaekwangia sp.]|nr:DoxX family protein [Ohtaekwangia sp.]
MKRDKVIYWITTGLVAAAMLTSATMYLMRNPELMQSFETLGIPLYFVTMLGITKLLGAIALIIPGGEKLKEWAYAGFAFTFIGAVWTHIATGTPWIAPLIFLALLSISYLFRLRVSKAS